jgi:alpha-acetolactate decarboxylase
VATTRRTCASHGQIRQVIDQHVESENIIQASIRTSKATRRTQAVMAAVSEINEASLDFATNLQTAKCDNQNVFAVCVPETKLFTGLRHSAFFCKKWALFSYQADFTLKDGEERKRSSDYWLVYEQR